MYQKHANDDDAAKKRQQVNETFALEREVAREKAALKDEEFKVRKLEDEKKKIDLLLDREHEVLEDRKDELEQDEADLKRRKRLH